MSGLPIEGSKLRSCYRRLGATGTRVRGLVGRTRAATAAAHSKELPPALWGKQRRRHVETKRGIFAILHSFCYFLVTSQITFIIDTL